MGVVGGLFGTSFVLVNKKITILRTKLQMSKGAKAIEAALIGMCFMETTQAHFFHREF